MKKYNLYIGESGTQDYSSSLSTNERYLGLLGLCISEEQVVNVLCPRFLKLGAMVLNNKGVRPYLFYENIFDKKRLLANLNDSNVWDNFKREFISLVEDLDYTIWSIVLDKKSFFDDKRTENRNPYYYAFSILLEKYALHLVEVDGQGSVVTTSRVKEEQRLQKEEYKRFINFLKNGTRYRGSKQIKPVVVSEHLKFFPRGQKVEGLELANLLATPATLYTLLYFGRIENIQKELVMDIINVIYQKYRVSAKGSIKGYGVKLITSSDHQSMVA